MTGSLIATGICTLGLLALHIWGRDPKPHTHNFDSRKKHEVREGKLVLRCTTWHCKAERSFEVYGLDADVVELERIWTL